MKIDIKNSAPPVDAATLKGLEAALGVKLPADYRRFIQKHNGGYPSPACFDVPGYEYGSFVKYFCHIDSDEFAPSDKAPVYSLRRTMHGHPAPLPEDSLIIGVAVVYDPIFTLVRGPNRGHIYLKDTDKLGLATVDNPNWEGNPQLGVQHVADSFDEFFALLRPDRPD